MGRDAGEDAKEGDAAVRRVERLMRDDEELQGQLRELERTPPPPPEAEQAARLREARKAEVTGITAGAIALAAALFALPFVAAFPAGILLVDVCLAWGAMSWVRFLIRRRQLVIDNSLIASLLPLIAIPSLARFLAVELGLVLPLGLRFTVAVPVVLVVLTTGLLALANPNRRSSWVRWGRRLSLGLALAMLLAIAAASPNRPVGAWATLGLTLAVVALALAAQAIMARMAKAPGWRALESAPALGLAAAQLLDGAVSYLAVGNPFGLLERASQEQIWLSAFLIQWTGPGYLLAKWTLALVLVRVLDGPGARSRLTDPVHRLGLYLLMAYISMGPAIYSTVRLFL